MKFPRSRRLGVDPKIVLLIAAALLLGSVLRASPASAASKCSMDDSQPNSGTLTLKFLRASTR